MSTVHRLMVQVEFPAGLYVGEARERNRLELARDGAGRPVLRGSSLAGALRHAYAARLGSTPDAAPVARWFGQSCVVEDEGGQPSPLRIDDALLDFGKGLEERRSHIARDRHSGATLAGSLFALTATPPGTKARLRLSLYDATDEAADFLRAIVGMLDEITFGGSAARGLGRARVVDARLRSFVLTSLADHAAYLDEAYSIRAGRVDLDGQRIQPSRDVRTLEVRLELQTPRGQDVLVADGLGLDHEMEPQRAIDVNGNDCWRIPGSSLRGVMRAWIARLAARDGKPVADSLEARRRMKPDVYDGDALAHGLADQSERARLRDDPDRVQCPVLRLFGSAYAKGRIHISDGFAAACPRGEEPVRKHVAVDRVTGGAHDGLLFSNTIVPAGARFGFTLTITDPSADEARWIATTLRAIDMGILRIGSSKSAGRLALAAAPAASGPHAAAFAGLGER